MASSKRNPEVEAVQVVHQALASLEPEGRARVIRAVCSLLEVAGSVSSDSPGFPGRKEQDVKQNKDSTALPNQIATFVSSKRPADTYQRLACLAYYLEHHDSKIDLSAKDFIKANTDARQVKVSNTSTFLDLATRRHGLFTAAGHGKKRLSARGAAVVEALPDQAAVKAALQQHSLPRRTGRKRKKSSNK